MATIGTLYPTLVDITKRTDPTGNIADVVEGLSKVNPILQDIAWKEGNLPTGHTYTSRAALPTPSWRKFNQGVAPTKSVTEQYTETCGMLEAYSKVDVALANLNGNSAAFRSDEDKAFAMGYGIEVARALFYESLSTNPERIHGLTPRLNATSGNPASAQIVKCPYVTTAPNGSDQTSIWLVGWSPDTVFGIYPKGSVAGLKNEDLGKVLTKDSGGTNEFTAWVTHWSWQLGLCVRDYRYLVRICNIDTASTGGWKADLSDGPDIVLGLMDAIAAMYDLTSVQPVFYMNRATYSMFNKQLVKKATVNLLEYLDRGGARVPHFMGIPIRIVDTLTSTEAIVS
jgi:hypothetical protein